MKGLLTLKELETNKIMELIEYAIKLKMDILLNILIRKLLLFFLKILQELTILSKLL